MAQEQDLERIEITDADAQSLQQKLDRFAQTLTPGELAAFSAAVGSAQQVEQQDVEPYVYYDKRNNVIGASILVPGANAQHFGITSGRHVARSKRTDLWLTSPLGKTWAGSIINLK